MGLTLLALVFFFCFSNRSAGEIITILYEVQITNHGTLHPLDESPPDNQAQQLNQHDE